MALTIITKNSDVAGLVPSAGQLVKGELAVNVTDRALYTLDAANNVVLLSSGSNYTSPLTVNVNSSSTAVTVTQTGSGGGMRITNTGAGNSLLVEDSANPDSTPFVVKADGSVIVGYTTSVTGTGPATATSPPLQVHGITNNTSSLGLYNWSSTGSLVDTLSFNRSLSNTIGTFGGAVTSGVDLGAISFSGDDGTSFIEGARIVAEVDGTPGTNDMPGRLVFSTTADGASTPTERLRITSTGALAINGSTSYGTAGQALISAGNTAPVWTDQFLSITYIFSGIAANDQGDLTIPFACTITEWTLLADASGSAVIDIWKDTYANYPPTVADTITGSAKPTISAATKGQSSTLTGWTTTISAGDTLRFNVDSASGVSRVTLSLKVKRT
jgi:hypothetical protein